MTQEERAAIRARCEAATPGPWERYFVLHESHPNAEFIVHARQDIPALLAALDEAEAENKALFDTQIEHEAAIKENLTDDRDHWRHRAKALELVILTQNDWSVCTACYSCVHHPDCPYDAECENFGMWLFDEARFAGKDGE